jgi:hypothetical protein
MTVRTDLPTSDTDCKATEIKIIVRPYFLWTHPKPTLPPEVDSTAWKVVESLVHVCPHLRKKNCMQIICKPGNLHMDNREFTVSFVERTIIYQLIKQTAYVLDCCDLILDI